MRSRTQLVLLIGLVTACSESGPGPALDRSSAHERLSAADALADQRREARALDLARDAGRDRPHLPELVAPTGPLRVMTLNLHCLLDQPDQRAQGIALQIQKLAPDGVALQEVCETVGSGGSDNMGTKIVAALKGLGGSWQLSFAKTHVSWQSATFAGYDEGIGVLAPQGSVLGSGEQLLFGAADFPRKVAWARLSTPRGAFYLYSTHLTISSDWTERTKQVQSILGVVNGHLSDGLPQIVAGDFNDKPWSGPIQAMQAGPPAFTDTWAARNPGQPGNTIPCPAPSERIDYIFARTAAMKSLSQVVLLDAQYQGACLSDHVGVFAEL